MGVADPVVDHNSMRMIAVVVVAAAAVVVVVAIAVVVVDCSQTENCSCQTRLHRLLLGLKQCLLDPVWLDETMQTMR